MKLEKVPSLVTVAVITTITIVFWIIFGVYRVLTTQPSPAVPPEILEPLTPTLDENTISKIEKSAFIEEGQITTPTLAPSPTASALPTPTITPTASPSASPTTTTSPSATPTGG